MSSAVSHRIGFDGSMYPLMVVIVQLPSNSFKQFSFMFKPAYITKLQLEVLVKTLLEAVLPRATTITVAHLPTSEGDQLPGTSSCVFAALVGMEKGWWRMGT